MMRPIPLLMTVCVGAILVFSALMWMQDEAVPELAEIAPPEQKVSEVQAMTPNSKKPIPEVMLHKDFKQSVQGIAKSFAAQSRFPATSMPIRDEEALQKYIPNQAMGASLPYEGPDGESLRFGLRTNKYRYFEDEVIEAYVSLTGGETSLDANVVISIVADRKILHQVANGPLVMGSFKAVIETKSINTSGWPKELHLQAVAQINGETMQVVETFRYEPQIATVKSVGKGTIEDDYLVIPIAIDTDARGYFRITGVLFSETTQKPLLHLEGKSKITINNDTVELKAQLRSLQVADDEGPYQLKHLWLEKMPGPPDYETAYGVADEEAYSIDDHSFDEYSDVDYEDPAAKRSLEFLNKIGGATQEN